LTFTKSMFQSERKESTYLVPVQEQDAWKCESTHICTLTQPDIESLTEGTVTFFVQVLHFKAFHSFQSPILPNGGWNGTTQCIVRD